MPSNFLSSLSGNLLTIIAGVLLLLFGRRLYWLFVGLAGFVLGLYLGQQWFGGQSALALIIAILLGVAFGFLAVLFRRIAVSIAGFILGGYLALTLAAAVNLQLPASIPDFVIFIAGGIIGLILIASIFDMALVILSSIAGAVLIDSALRLESLLSLLLFILLVIVGIIVQTGQLRRRR